MLHFSSVRNLLLSPNVFADKCFTPVVRFSFINIIILFILFLSLQAKGTNDINFAAYSFFRGHTSKYSTMKNQIKSTNLYAQSSIYQHNYYMQVSLGMHLTSHIVEDRLNHLIHTMVHLCSSV